MLKKKRNMCINELKNWWHMRHMKTWLQLKRKEKSPLGKHHRSNCCRKDPLVNVKISGWKFEEKYDLHSLNASPQKYFLTIKRVTWLWRNWQKPPYPVTQTDIPGVWLLTSHTPDTMHRGECGVTLQDSCPECTTSVEAHENIRQIEG